MENLQSVKRFEPHTHSYYSNLRLLDCINRPIDIIKTAYEKGLSGIALTDHEFVGNAIEWLDSERKLKEQGTISPEFKCALGNEIYLVPSLDKNQIRNYYHFILIAKDTIGYKALRELSSEAWLNSRYDRGMERVPTSYDTLTKIVNKYPGHLIATTACIGGQLGHLIEDLAEAEKTDSNECIYDLKCQIKDFILYCKNLFHDDFYVEIAPGDREEQVRHNSRCWAIAKSFDCKVVIGTDAHYLTKEQRPIHKAYLTSKPGKREVDAFYSSTYIMSYGEICEYFLRHGATEDQIKELCNNSVEIMDKISNYDIERKSIIPTVEVKDYPKSLSLFGVNNSWRDELDSNYPTIKALLLSDNIQERYWINECLLALINKKDCFNTEYLSRIETEAAVIKHIGNQLETCLYAYFNTFKHYIDLFWNCGSIVGPGRGSAVCFLTNYLLGITQIDPVKWNIAYWRFLNMERVELPDIDIDLAPSCRPLIFKKIREEIGETRLLQVCTFSSEGTRRAIQTACRGYRTEEYPEGIDSDVAQFLSGMIPQERGFLWPLSDVVYGNPEKDRKPITQFIDEVNKYDGLLDIMTNIEGLINGRSQHASGVILYNVDPTETNAIMRAPKGAITTQFALHESERLGDVKYDFLLTEICDKIITAIHLLQNDKEIEPEMTVRQLYNKYLHPESLDLKDRRIWDALASGNIMDVFQFNSDVGLAAAKMVKPDNPIEMMTANALLRLMGEKGKERPLERYVRLKFHIQDLYDEMTSRNLTAEEIATLEKYYLPRHGVPAMQEDLMTVVMDPNIAHFTLKEANDARKIVAKKQMDRIPELKKKFLDQCPNTNFGNYIWETVMGPQMGYSFSVPHSLAYSFVGIQTLVLATKWNPIYWDTACLIVNSGGLEEQEEVKIVDIHEVEDEDEDDDDENAEYEDLPDRSAKKKKVKTVNYGRIATAIGQMKSLGIQVSTPDINKSTYTFSPNTEVNQIRYGLKGINKISNDLCTKIIAGRPYKNLEDFQSRIPLTKPQTLNLIKSGAFDCFDENRRRIMDTYIDSIADSKKKLTLANVPMLINYNLFPDKLNKQKAIYNFNKYLKKNCKLKEYYLLKDYPYDFYEANFNTDLLIYDDNGRAFLNQKDWKKIYDIEMEPIRNYLRHSQDEILQKLNQALFDEKYDAECSGTISKWEMDSVSFYYHPHELAKVKLSDYGIVDFNKLDETPEINRICNIKGKQIPIYSIFRIAGTVLDKNKNKSSITLLTTTGVVNVKMYGLAFNDFDKQISVRGADGKKKIIEKSWFARGNKLIFTGVRQGDTFLVKKYKGTPYPLIEFITDISSNNKLITKSERELGE